MKTTTKYRFPYPEPPDNTQTWTYWQGLAEAVDAQMSKFQCSGGYADVVFPGTGGISSKVAVTFAAGTFTGAPYVVGAQIGNLYNIVGISDLSATSASFQARNVTGSAAAGTLRINYVAVRGSTSPTAAPLTMAAMAASRSGSGGSRTVTCHTVGCSNEGIPIEVPYDETPPDSYFCGVCGQEITDIT